MALITIEPPREGFGADRFLIRNGARARNEIAIALRPFIQELPERLVDPAQFPPPGRRGPSRITPTFPRATDRREESENIVLSEAGIAAEIGGTQALACIPSQTRTFSLSQTLTTGTSRARGTIAFPWAFRITHFETFTLAAVAGNVAIVALFVAPGIPLNDVASPGRVGVTLRITGAASGVNVQTVPKVFYPGFVVSQPNWHVQITFDNPSASTVDFFVLLELERLG